MALTYQFPANMFRVGDIVKITTSSGEYLHRVINNNGYYALFDNNVKSTSNKLHINKQRAQSKINGKNSRWS